LALILIAFHVTVCVFTDHVLAKGNYQNFQGFVII